MSGQRAASAHDVPPQHLILMLLFVVSGSEGYNVILQGTMSCARRRLKFCYFHCTGRGGRRSRAATHSEFFTLSLASAAGRDMPSGSGSQIAMPDSSTCT